VGCSGLAIAAQAFLLSTALAPSTEPLGRLLAAIAGIAALGGAMHLLVKQTYHFDLDEAVIERERQALELDSVQLDGLRELEFPASTQFVKAGWQEKPHLIWAIKLKARNLRSPKELPGVLEWSWLGRGGMVPS
jgi:hypothetical protein